jgi:hypothetical protein
MSDLWIFVFGVAVFITTAWATFAFGLARVHELQRQDLEASPRIKAVEDQGLTELYVTQRIPEEQARTTR